MTRAEKFIQDYTNHCSNEIENGVYHEWLTPKQARRAVEIAKEEMLKEFEKNRLKHCNSITNEQAEMEQGFIDQHIDKYQRMPTFLDAIEYGMRLQKEQMMAKAIDGVIAFDYYGNDNKTYGCIAHDSFCLEDFGLKDNDNVKMIIFE